MPGCPRCAIVSAACPAGSAALRPPELPTLLPVLRPLLPLPPLLLCALWSPFAKPGMTGPASRGWGHLSALPSISFCISCHLPGTTPHKHALLYSWNTVALSIKCYSKDTEPYLESYETENMPCEHVGWLLVSCGDMDAALSWNPEKPLLLES